MPERWKIHPMPASYFTADDLEKIADAVDKGKLKEDSVRALHMAALAYVTCLVIEQKPGPEDNWPPDAQLYGRADRRAALKRIGRAAIKLKEALDDGLPKLLMERSALTEIDTALLHQLANDADAISRDIPKRGSDPERARRYFGECPAHC